MAMAYVSLWKLLQNTPDIERLVFEIVGESHLLGLQLPCDKPLSQLQLARTLLFRLKLVFDSHRFLLFQNLRTETLSRNWILRIIIFVLDICSSVERSQHNSLDYLLFRRNALETLLSAVSLLLLSQASLSFEEDDLLQAAFHRLKESWQCAEELSTTEQALLEIMTSALARLEDCDSEHGLFRRPDKDSPFTVPISVAMDNERIQQSMSELVDAVDLQNPSAFLKAYHSISQLLGMWFEMDSDDYVGKIATEKCRVVMSILSVKLTTSKDASTTLCNFLWELFVGGLSVINGLTKEAGSSETPMMERTKRINKVEVPEFYGFCCRGQQCNPWLQSSPTGLYASSIQPHPRQDSAYDGSSSRPLSSISAATYSTDGLHTPFRSPSPMSMNAVISNRAESEASPIWSATTFQTSTQLSRSQCRIRRKTLSSPRSRPGRIEEVDHNHRDVFEKKEHPSLFGDRVAAVISSLANAHQEAQIPCLHEKGGLRPSPLQVRRPSSTTEPHALVSVESSAPQNDNRMYEVAIHQGAPQVDPLRSSAMKISIPGDLPQTLSNPLSPVSPEGSFLGASDCVASVPSLTRSSSRRRRLQDGLESKAKCVPEGYERSTYDDDQRMHGRMSPPLGADATNASLSYTRAKTSGAPGPAVENCTLELVNDLSSIEQKVSQAYRGSLDSTIPARIDQPFPTPYPIEKEVESGLELAPQFVPPVMMRKISYPHPERAESDGLSLHLSAKSSNSSESKLRYFRRLGGGKETTAATSIPSLPLNLQSCFSSCSSSLLLWSKKDSNYIVQVRSPLFTSGQRLDLTPPTELHSDPTKAQKSLSIRLVAGNSTMVAAYACSNKEYRLYAICANGNQYSVLLGEGISLATSLTVSLRYDLIALGCGSSILIYHVHGGLSQISQLGIDSSASSIRLQRLSFSTDSKRLVVATQVSSQISDRQTVRFMIWERNGDHFEDVAQVDPTQLTMGYGTDSGLTSVFHSSTPTPQIFLAASVSKPYPSILSTNKETRSRHLHLADKRIISAAQCVTEGSKSDHLLVIQSGHHKLLLVDVHSAVTKLLVDFSSERRKIELGREAIALGIVSENQVYACWVSADKRLVLKSISARSKIKSTDLTELYLQVRGL